MKINIHTSHSSAFISSTFIDLQQERNAVAKVLREANLNVNALDIKPASSNSSRKEIISGIKESDFIILIVGERYGSIIPRMTLKKDMSITRWEYDQAVRIYGKNVLVYFKKIQSDDQIHFDDRSLEDFEIKQTYLRDFKELLSNSHKPDYFSTADELAEKIKKAIIPTYRSGVKDLVIENESLRKRIGSLEQEVLKIKNESLTHIEPLKDGMLVGLSQAVPRGLGLLEVQKKRIENQNSNIAGLGLLAR